MMQCAGSVSGCLRGSEAQKERLFPETDAEVLEKQHQWLAEYNEKIATFATCRYIGSLNGPNGIAVNDAARYHDERTNAMTNLPLA